MRSLTDLDGLGLDPLGCLGIDLGDLGGNGSGPRVEPGTVT